MKLTLAEAAIGAGAVLEAPSSIARAGELVAQAIPLTRAPWALAISSSQSREIASTATTSSSPRRSEARSPPLSPVPGSPPCPTPRFLFRCSLSKITLVALQALAHHVRRHWGKRVVAVTGSAGKTTTKEAIAAALSAKFNVLKSKGNLNNAYGLPLQLLRLEPEHEYAVVEMGMNHLGEIAALARIAAPDWGVVTNVGTAHIENFTEGQAGIARAKYELIAALPANGTAFLNCADPFVSQFGRDFQGKVVYFGFGPCADPQIVEQREDAAGLHVRYRAGEHDGDFKLHLLGAHNASNAIAGLAVALEAGVDRDAAIRALETLTPGDKRGEVLEIGGATILNDSYNSNPEALQSMIRTLAARSGQAPHPGRRRDARTGRHTPQPCMPPAARPPPRPASILWWACAAMPNTSPPLPARAASKRSFCPMPRLPAHGSSRICARAMWLS